MTTINGWEFGEPIVVPDNLGDTFAPALADDGRLYTPSNDTLGFEVPDFFTAEKSRLFQSDLDAFWADLTPQQRDEFLYRPIGFERLEGDDPTRLRGETVNRMTEYRESDRYRAMLEGEKPPPWLTHGMWKTSGCTFIDGALYLVVARHGFEKEEPGQAADSRQWAQDASIIRSTDLGRTWTRTEAENLASPMFPGSDFATPFFIDDSRATSEGAPPFVYALSNNGFWDNGDHVIVGRVPRGRMERLDASDWTFYRGGDGGHEDAWASDAKAATPVLREDRRFGMTGATYLPHRGVYVMIGWFYPGGDGHSGDSTTTQWDLYESPQPWGPWARVASHTWSPQGFYGPLICPKFGSGDTLYISTAGDFKNWWDHYRLTLVPVTFS